jgi:hypothetical protein
LSFVIGHRTWAVPGVNNPAATTGVEPTTTGEDFLCVLNAEERHAHVQVTIFYTNRDPVGPYGLTVAARRVRQVRFNDLVGPQAVAVDTPYAAIVTADIPVVVQYVRQDTGQRATPLSMIAFPVPEQRR